MRRATSSRSLLIIPFAIPTYCSPDQALAMAKLLEGVRELILADCPMLEPAKPHKSPASNKSDSSPSNGRNDTDEDEEELPF